MDRQILETLHNLATKIDDLKALVQRTLPPEIASDRELDGKYGDPIVRFIPKDWTPRDGNRNFVGRKYSECPAELLDALADAKEYFASKADENGELANNGKPKSQYERRDAAKARGWAKRIRNGYVSPATQPVSDSFDVPSDDEIGF